MFVNPHILRGVGVLFDGKALETIAEFRALRRSFAQASLQGSPVTSKI